MKGLLIKDWQLLFQRKQTLVIFLGVCLFTGFTIDGGFIMGYMAFLSAIIALSTISYDETDNGMLFLMTLPVSRKTYSLSKYVLGALFSVAALVLSVLLQLLVNRVKGLPANMAENVLMALSFFPMSLLVLDLMIPLQLKFGAEKSRIMMMIVFGAIAALGMLLSRNAVIATTAVSLLNSMDQMSEIVLITAFILGVVVLTFVSILISIRIMKKKVF